MKIFILQYFQYKSGISIKARHVLWIPWCEEYSLILQKSEVGRVARVSEVSVF